ncbi:MAG: hypothetical protein MPEBLZ_02647 [Candidatus Methanoperedens nitroreducens]|uniref:UPF0216 protein MPEBLZ_02647 n=1 Tax=Candidatus Methanoperedens nitratireducens TaxID=1392998 RepID=A0A0P8DYE0_9EURY|nr:DUF61 family protein [Candidatus Methanoperedens sp. BLZ2]KPQ42806.1 MAG: hypothetical protein MPEBLZ_02647 [Candidatus Methanoperedens sp. BLZ1]MBZ0173667.1 DUF61 family protein [Candidatus Methanoperedens nitroreducens]MCX9076343.1 DUF61 family protein [Candidatus Methanoperedens sp.]
MFNENNFEKMISMKFIQTLNRHLPAKRRTLKELLAEDRPNIKNLDGSTHSFDKKELEKIASIIPGWEHDKLRLPIYLEMCSSMERGTIKISGRVESMVVNRVLYDDEELKKKDAKDFIIIYYPHLRKVRKELPTTTQFMFTM